MNFKLLLAVLKTKYKSFGNRAFNKASHLLWNSLPTVFIGLQAEQLLHKSLLNLGKFEAVEEVSAYSWVFFY